MTDVTPRPTTRTQVDDERDTGPGPGPSTTAGQPSRPGAALDGVVSGGVALGVGTLLAGILSLVGAAGGTPSPVPAVGGAFVDRTPPWLKDFAVNTFGTHDKLALFAGMAVVLVAACAGIGLLSRTRRLLALVLLAVVGALGMAAVMSRPNASAPDILPTLLGTAAGIDTLVRLRRDGSELTDSGLWSPLSRRRVLAGGGAALAALLGSRLSGGGSAARESRAEAVIPTPAVSASPVSVTGASVNVPGVTPFVVPNEDFYRIDTALVVPQLDTATWSLRVWARSRRR